MTRCLSFDVYGHSGSSWNQVFASGLWFRVWMYVDVVMKGLSAQGLGVFSSGLKS